MPKGDKSQARKSPHQHDATLRKMTEHMGPDPGASLAAMVDLGLSDIEIGRYYRISPATITRLRYAFNIMRDL